MRWDLADEVRMLKIDAGWGQVLPLVGELA